MCTDSVLLYFCFSCLFRFVCWFVSSVRFRSISSASLDGHWLRQAEESQGGHFHRKRTNGKPPRRNESDQSPMRCAERNETDVLHFLSSFLSFFPSPFSFLPRHSMALAIERPTLPSFTEFYRVFFFWFSEPAVVKRRARVLRRSCRRGKNGRH